MPQKNLQNLLEKYIDIANTGDKKKLQEFCFANFKKLSNESQAKFLLAVLEESLKRSAERIKKRIEFTEDLTLALEVNRSQYQKLLEQREIIETRKKLQQ